MKQATLLILLLTSIQYLVHGQDKVIQKYDLKKTNVSLREILAALRKDHLANISFDNSLRDLSIKKNISIRQKSIAQILFILLKDTDLSFKLIGENYVIFPKEELKEINKIINNGEIGSIIPKQDPKNYIISGYIEDASSSEKLIAATVFDSISQKGVISNTYGFYSLSLPSRIVNLKASYVGFQQGEFQFFLSKDTTVHFYLNEGESLQEIQIIESRTDKSQNRVQMSQVDIPVSLIKKAPALLGETDVLKVLQLLPGVKAGGEGQNGLYIRGGSLDQNLILLDGVPVYNVSHLGGFFSVFNGDAIRNVTLTKGGFPARYGGRLSSVIEIDMKEGNMKEFNGEGGIGLISSRLTLEGPVWKDKISFLVSGRRTYLDLIAAPFLKAEIKNGNGTPGYKTKVDLDAHFYDFNAKINYRINDAHRIYLSVYNGKDIFGLALNNKADVGNDYNNTKGGFNWGNITSALRWNWLINKKLFANTAITFSDYKVNIGVSEGQQKATTINNNSARYISGIRDWSIKTDLDYIISPSYRIRIGIGEIYHTYSPGAIQFKTESINDKLDTLLGNRCFMAHEIFTYMENEFQLGRTKANIGLHASAFINQKKSYSSLQPRIGINTRLNPLMSFKVSFVTMRQYINLLTNERAGLPTDLWVPTTNRIKPQEAWQSAMGVTREINREYEFTIEAYFKKMNNLVSYTDGANLLSLGDWQDQVTQGKGTSYGTELFLQKKSGKTNGWVGYTLSWNNRTFKDLNNGLTYPFKYDSRHDIALLVNHTFSNRFSLSASWQYRTGNAVTLPSASYQGINGVNQFNYSTYKNYWFLNFNDYEIIDSKNNYRMASYHRLDLSLEWAKKKKNYNRARVLGAYNAYSRNNPFYIAIRDKYIRENNIIKYKRVATQVSLFPIIPYFSYNFKF